MTSSARSTGPVCRTAIRSIARVTPPAFPVRRRAVRGITGAHPLKRQRPSSIIRVTPTVAASRTSRTALTRLAYRQATSRRVPAGTVDARFMVVCQVSGGSSNGTDVRGHRDAFPPGANVTRGGRESDNELDGPLDEGREARPGDVGPPGPAGHRPRRPGGAGALRGVQPAGRVPVADGVRQRRVHHDQRAGGVGALGGSGRPSLQSSSGAAILRALLTSAAMLDLC